MTNIPPPLEATPAPYYSHWDEQGESTGDSGSEVNQRLCEETSSNPDGQVRDSPSPFDTCTIIDDEEVKKYECAVCFEVMDTPVGCGSCQTRFCRPCLERVAKQGGTRPKCSHCRAPFTIESIQVDEALQEEMKNCMQTVLCPFRGCGKKILLSAIKLHESQCEHIRMKCRYVEWGCEWIGKKKDLEYHNCNECEFRAEMGRLVNVIREKTLNQAETIARLQGTRVNQAVNSHTRHLLMVRGRNAGNIFDVFAMSYEAICFPGRFAATKVMWGDMITQEHSRSLVFNTLMVSPLILCGAKCAFWMAFDLSNTSPQRLAQFGLRRLLKQFELNVISSTSALLAVFFLLLDEADATQWTETILPGTNVSHIFIRDLVAFFSFAAFYLFVEFMEYWPGIALLLCTFSFTVTFTSCVATIVEKVNGSEQDTMKKSRLWSAMVFALRYSCLFQIVSHSEAMKGVIVLRLVRHASVKRLKVNFTVEETECFISLIPSSILVAFGAAMTALDHMAYNNGNLKDWSTALCEWYIGAAVLAFLNVFTHSLFLCGQGSGIAIYGEGENLRNHSILSVQSYNILPSQRPGLTGVATISLAVFYGIFMVCV
eukprot:CAMPEP_0201692060 /NCGR_PEP_ID=MMETSP0578-20130828/5064_1 /ASSEMBLY_ACC=CAM_ASM_000663 /TAXON_ID=267565 /ORGANISM="Skeletonema grethea, Strain CCMP 1804" /LENGTH=598 /DNA_ID=CAMNT_0048177381 /DNA_START=163 /DNA_END=1959 /DNA_ORIENTATION=-